jgi:hypothetical protein
MAERGRLWQPRRWLPPLGWRIGIAAVLGSAAGSVALLASVVANGGFSARLCLGVCLAVAVAMQLVRETMTELPPLDRPSEASPVESSEYFVKLRQLQRRLESASRDASKYDRNVLPVLQRLATDRLRQKYGIDPNRQPARCREVLGEQLWSLIRTQTAQFSPPPSQDQLRALIECIESL